MNKKLFKNEIRQIGFEYVKLLLEVKYGCKVKPVEKQDEGPTMQVWSPKGYQKSTMQVNVESNSSETVAILIAHVINGRPIPIQPDYHIIKFVGVEGAYCLDEEDFQEFLLDKHISQETSEDGNSLYSIYDRKILLDSCTFIAP